MHRSPATVSAVLFAAAALATALQPAQALADREHLAAVHGAQALDKSVQSLRLVTGGGDVEVLRATGDKLEITADVRVYRDKAKDLANPDQFEQHVRVTTEGDTLTIADAHKDAADHDAWNVALKVAVPRALAVSVTTGAGDVVITFAAGDLHFETGAGDVTLKIDFARAITGTTGAGDIELAVETVTGRIEVNSGAGDVELALGTAAGPLEVRSGAGNIGLKLTKGGAEKDVKLQSSAGNVWLELPPAAIGRFTLSAGTGSISTPGCDFIKIVSRGVGATASGSSGEGGPQYTLSSSVGSIRLQRRE